MSVGVCVCVCVFVQHAGKEGTELKLHRGMKARGNFKREHELSEKLFLLLQYGVFRQSICEMTHPAYHNREQRKLFEFGGVL